MNKLNVWWPTGPQPGNFGDILTPLILRKLFNSQAVYTRQPYKTPTLMGVGSIASLAQTNSVVWGSGFMRRSDIPSRGAVYLSVRGPLTHEMLECRKIRCPPIFGDPALLMPSIYNPEVSKKYKYGIFAHYVDTEQVSRWYNQSDVLIINPLSADPLNVIDKVLQCENIISSSLHGIIIAHAYGIPAAWVKHSDKLNGDGLKFDDYYASVNLKGECFNFTSKLDPVHFNDMQYTVGIDIDMTKMINVLKAYIDE